jgi:hypothetical protein
MRKEGKLTGVAPRRPRRAVELFASAQFRPRVVKSKRVYSRRPRNNRDQNQ